MLKRIILSGISFCIAISLTVLSVLAKQQAVPEKTVVSSRPPVSSLSVESSSSEIESSSEEVSSSEPESSEPVSSAPPAPAPVQKITGKVTKDPQFKPTEENKKRTRKIMSIQMLVQGVPLRFQIPQLHRQHLLLHPSQNKGEIQLLPSQAQPSQLIQIIRDGGKRMEKPTVIRTDKR